MKINSFIFSAVYLIVVDIFIYANELGKIILLLSLR